MKKLACLLLLTLAGCQGLIPGNPSPQSGLLVQYYSPPVVHLPVVADASTGATNTTHIGSHKIQYSPPAQPAAPMPVVPVPKIVPQRGNGCEIPCSEE